MPWLIFILVVGIGLTIIYFKYVKPGLLYKNGIPATAKIIAMEKTNVEYTQGSENSYDLNKIEYLMRITLEIYDSTVAPRSLIIKQAFRSVDMPEVGTVVNVLIAPKDENYVIIVL